LVKIAAVHEEVRPDSSQERRVFWEVNNDDVWRLREAGTNIEDDWKALTGSVAGDPSGIDPAPSPSM
jgi:hypothetical protein